MYVCITSEQYGLAVPTCICLALVTGESWWRDSFKCSSLCYQKKKLYITPQPIPLVDSAVPSGPPLLLGALRFQLSVLD